MPHDPAYQLLAGRPSSAREESAWDSLRHPTRALAQRYGADRFDLTILLREIVLRLEKFAHPTRRRPEFFLVSVDAKVNRYLDARPPSTAILEIFTRAVRDRVLAANDYFSGCDLHPYFQILREFINLHRRFEIDGGSYGIEEIADYYFTDPSGFKFINHAHIYQISDNLNSVFSHLYQSVQGARERAKSFRRTPIENRRRLMQYASHLLDGEPRTVVAHLTIRRDAAVIGGGPPISRGMADELRKKLVKHIKCEIPDSDYLGHAILLKRDAILGCWMEAFVFFTKNDLVRDADVLAKLINRWNGEIGPGRAGCVGENLFQAHSGADKRYSQTLERIVLVTEPDFYCRVSAEGLHRFWCTQSPVGKLAERTRQNKRRETEKKRAVKAPSTPVSRLQEAALADRDLMLDARWAQARERHNVKISKRRKKAAKTRSQRKDSQNIAASAPAPTYMTAVRYARIDAANDESMGPRHDADSCEMGSTGSAHPTDLRHRRPRAPAPGPLSADDTPTRPLRPIQLERRPREVTESGTSRPKVKVEVGKKRRQSRKPED